MRALGFVLCAVASPVRIRDSLGSDDSRDQAKEGRLGNYSGLSPTWAGEAVRLDQLPGDPVLSAELFVVRSPGNQAVGELIQIE